MALINIMREDGTPDTVEESLLVRTDLVFDNDDEHVDVVQYCFPDSEVVVHRSVHVTLKKWPEGMQPVLASLV